MIQYKDVGECNPLLGVRAFLTQALLGSACCQAKSGNALLGRYVPLNIQCCRTN